MSIEAMNWALEQTTGSAASKCVLLILANRAHPTTGECFPGLDGIAKQADMSRRSVIRQIQHLEATGLVSVLHRGGDGDGRKSNVYQLHVGQSANLSHRGKVPICHQQSANLAGQSANVSPEPKENPKTSNPKRGTVPDFSSVDGLNLEAWGLWMADRKARRLPKYKTTREAKRLAKLPHEAQMACVEYSLDRYQGLVTDRFDRRSSGKPSYAEQLAADMRTKGML